MKVALAKITVPRDKKEIKKEEHKIEILGYQEVDEKEFWSPMVEILADLYIKYKKSKESEDYEEMLHSCKS